MGERIVQSTANGPIAVLTLDRPKALNALNGLLMEQLAAALEAADADPQVRAVVITGSERAFCAGADITGLDAVSVDEMLAPQGFGRRLFDVLTSYRKPLIAAVRGLALGGGCEIALACDIVIAGESARFGVPEVVPDENCLAAAIKIAERIARNAPLAVQMAKDAARTTYDTTLAQGLAHERRNFFLLFNTDDMREGVSAFIEKRSPTF